MEAAKELLYRNAIAQTAAFVSIIPSSET